MGHDNSLEISYDEWRSFFMVNPGILESITGDPNEMLRYWRGATVSDDLFLDRKARICVFRFVQQHVDLGESPYIALEDEETENKRWWKNLVAGGCAGAVSRTATAPFDRLKIIMQV